MILYDTSKYLTLHFEIRSKEQGVGSREIAENANAQTY